MIKSISENLAKLFIKNYQDIKNTTIRSKYGILEGWLSVVFNLILGGLKIIVAIIIGSISLLADGIHSLTDMITSFIVISSFYLGRKPSDEEHPFGHGRMEEIAALIMAVLIGVGGFELIKSGFERVFNPQPVQMSLVAIFLLLLTVIFKEILSRISKYYGEKIVSTALEADSWHHRTDAISSILVIVAIVASQFGYAIVDGFVGIIIGLFIIYTGIEIARRTGYKLLGTQPSKELLDQVESIALKTENALAIHDMVCHEYGTQMVISFHLEVPSHLKLSEAHTIADKIERKILNDLNIQATVHLDPVLPAIIKKDKIERIINKVISAERGILKYKDMRLIGEESHSSLVLNIFPDQTLGDENIELLTKRLKEEIRHQLPTIKDVNIIIADNSG